jgi:protein-tyrosine phosphatase
MTPPRDGRSRTPWNSRAADKRPSFTDVHCHCLAGLDDGPAGRIETLALCRSLAADGIETVVATPHQLGRYEGRYDAGAIRRAVAELNGRLQETRIALTVLPGADVRLDERIPQLVRSDALLTVADGRRYLLLELPHEVFIDPGALLPELASMGVTAIITHPERHTHLARRPEHVRRWVEHGACLQITAGSFDGDFGRQSQEAAWAFLHAPLPVLVATDAHNTSGRAPRMSAAYSLLAQQFGYLVADILCVENPRRVLEGKDLLMLAKSDMCKEVAR